MDRAHLHNVIVQELENADLPLPDGARVSGPVHAGLYSEVFRLDSSRPMALKVCHHPLTGAPDPAFARRQFEELSRVHQAMADPRYRVPRPILLIEEQAILLMEWAIGETLSRQLLSFSCRPARLTASLWKAGAWLRRFHDSGPRSREGLAARRLLGELEEFLRAQAAHLLAEPFVGRAMAALAAAAPRLQGTMVERSWLHGDFHMENLVLAGESVIALDVAFSRQDVAALDLAYFLNSLDRFLLLPKGWHRLPLRARLFDAFLRGYTEGTPGARPAQVDPAVLAWLRTLDLVRFFAILHAEGKSRLHNRYFAGSIRLVLRRLGAELERAAAGRREVHP